VYNFDVVAASAYQSINASEEDALNVTVPAHAHDAPNTTGLSGNGISEMVSAPLIVASQ
jgi:hypothetical protein